MSCPSELIVGLKPRGRFDVIDIGRLVDQQAGDLRKRYRRTLYYSLHTTAGYLERGLAARMAHRDDRLASFFRAFGTLFPPGGAYEHDQMERREELDSGQRQVEPKNGDSHLTFMGSGMTNCVTYSNRPRSAVYFIDLDGESQGRVRQRTTAVLGYDQERLVESVTLSVPVSRHPIDSVNLADPRLGVLERIAEMLKRAGIEKGRVDIAVEAGGHCGLTVNEYETLLMQHDLPEVLRNPLKFAAIKGWHMWSDPLSVPGKALNYAKYDVLRAANSLMDALGVNESVVERLWARLLALPARRLLRRRRVSLLASDHAHEGHARLVLGAYQSPILIQWRAAEDRQRQIQIRLVGLS